MWHTKNPVRKTRSTSDNAHGRPSRAKQRPEARWAARGKAFHVSRNSSVQGKPLRKVLGIMFCFPLGQ